MKSIQEQQKNFQLKLLLLSSKIEQIQKRILLFDNTTDLSTQLSSNISSLQSNITILNLNVSKISEDINDIRQKQQRLNKWRLDIQDLVSSLNNTTSEEYLPTNSTYQHAVKKDSPPSVVGEQNGVNM